jgi:hypothetical protein
LGDDRGVRLGLEDLGATQLQPGIPQPELPHDCALEMMAPHAGLNQGDLAFGAKNRQGESRKARSRPQIGKARQPREVRGQRRRVDHKAADDPFQRAMSGQVDPLRPAVKQSS